MGWLFYLLSYLDDRRWTLLELLFNLFVVGVAAVLTYQIVMGE